MKSYFRNLDSIIKKCQCLSLRDKMSIAYKISKGLCFLSSKSVLHRDLKPQNIVLDKNLNALLIDFGSSCPVNGSDRFNVCDKRCNNYVI